MGMIDNEEIRGYRVGEEISCEKCMKPEEIRALKEADLILQKELESEENLYFCDRCKKIIE